MKRKGMLILRKEGTQRFLRPTRSLFFGFHFFHRAITVERQMHPAV